MENFDIQGDNFRDLWSPKFANMESVFIENMFPMHILIAFSIVFSL